MIDIAVAQDTADYIYRYLPGHLAAAQDRDTLDRLRVDPGWLEAKLAVTSSPQGLVADYEQYGSGQLHALIGRMLRLDQWHLCARSKATSTSIDSAVAFDRSGGGPFSRRCTTTSDLSRHRSRTHKLDTSRRRSSPSRRTHDERAGAGRYCATAA